MKTSVKTLALIALTYSLLSCETLVDDLPLSRFPELKEKLVLTSFISPQDTVIFVSLNKSVPLFESQKLDTTKIKLPNGDSTFYLRFTDIVKNAEVYISDGVKTEVLKFEDNTSFYKISAQKFPIIAGKTYTITARSEGLEVSGTTTIPIKKVDIKNLVLSEKLDIRDSFYGKDSILSFQIDFSWKDVPNENNYYKINGELSYLSIDPISTYVENKVKVEYVEKVKYTYLAINNTYGASRGQYYTDKDADGNDFKISNATLTQYPTLAISNNEVFKSKPAKNANKTIKLQLLNISKEFYEYQISLFDFFQAENNPFSEPAPVYTNIKNGLGCVAGFNTNEVIIKK